ncbi:iron complex transport system substrate-binding protein [Desulfocicer vacuolatum DSM 3385]|uniref:Iron complex transport system substrate-binding protein n=1 Tax=Desulfocicer vacuolatum DSM 3385 TaxID=1121400 RepID=A0A1W2CBU0_9BACT|nr:ABC transporter substrate-binding protein [Desulfocicer vacuolatum]SMC82454.1 iron complex transport system substrate-binding protein [Desulfocicer vacuolatum DSM 3385]
MVSLNKKKVLSRGNGHGAWLIILFALFAAMSGFFLNFRIGACENVFWKAGRGRGLQFFFWVIMCWQFAHGVTFAGATEIVDARGETVTFDRPFQRIISLYGAHTENLFFLGLDQEIIGVSKNECYPEAAKQKKWFSYHDDPEKFLAAEPDLVLVRPMVERGYPALIERLRKSGITVVSLQPSSVDGLYRYWMALGTLTGKRERAKTMIRDFKARVSYFSQLTRDVKKKKRVYFEAIHSRMKTFVPGSMAIFVLESAGGLNVAPDAVSSRGTNIGIYGKERILSHAGEIDVFLAQTGVMNHTSLEIIKKEPGFRIIRAVKENQVYLIDEVLVSRPIFRLLIGIETIGKILYPKRFGSDFI